MTKKLIYLFLCLSLQAFGQGMAVDIRGAHVTVPVSGTFTPSDPIACTQSGAWTVASTQSGAWTVAATQSGAWTTTVSNFPATQPVSGSVSVSNFPASQAVTGTFFQATQPVSGTFFQATQPVSGTVAATQSGTWTVQPGNTANTSAWFVTQIPAAKSTYAAVVNGLAIAAAATDVFYIFGSGTKTVKIVSIEVSGTQTTTGNVTATIIKRTSANSGGTCSAIVASAYDSAAAAATATVSSCTANPTVGTSGRVMRVIKLFLPSVAATSDSSRYLYNFDSSTRNPPTLNGTAEGYAINFGGATVAGGSINAMVEWTEQ